MLDEVQRRQDAVVVMTVKAPKPWIAGNNEIIRSLPATHPNVIVLDWEARAAEIDGHLSGSDGGIHLSDDTAKQFYRDIILRGARPADLTALRVRFADGGDLRSPA